MYSTKICVYFGEMSHTFHRGSLSCTVNEGQISDELHHRPLKPQQGAGQVGQRFQLVGG